MAVGSAIGGLTALSLAVIDNRAAATVTNSSFFPLELTRREYRIKDHAFCHDYRAFNTYTSVYALLAPRPLMVQMGRKDALWLGHGPAEASSWFSGMKRGATVDETLGAAYVLERLWRTQGAPFELVVHPGEHETVDVARVDAFLRKVASR